MGSLGFLVPYSFSNYKDTLTHIFSSPQPLDVVLRTRLVYVIALILLIWLLILSCYVYGADNQLKTTYQVLNEVSFRPLIIPFFRSMCKLEGVGQQG
jgi:NAD kinase